MITKRVKKYLLILIAYTVILRIGVNGFQLYYTAADNPKAMIATIQSVTAAFAAATVVLNIVVVLIMLVDIKQKKVVDWLILAITLLSLEIGIVLFIVWLIYNESTRKPQLQN